MQNNGYSEESKAKMTAIVEKIFKGNKGILAMDERATTLGTKLESYGIDNTVDKRRSFRELLLRTNEIDKYIGGVIMNEETVDQTDSSGKPLAEYVTDRGMALGMKFDKGLVDLNSEEKHSIGLEDLPVRLACAAAKGIEFAKWRVVYNIANACPSAEICRLNAEALLSFTLAAQSCGIVPIAEPEISFIGAYTILDMEDLAKKLYRDLIELFNKNDVYLPGLVLKISFLCPGKGSPERVTIGEIAKRNVELLTTALPSEIGAIVFLSGGHDANEAFGYLEHIRKENQKHRFLSFSFARALTDNVIAIWKGDAKNNTKAQMQFKTNLIRSQFVS